jgi:hypothetical protein
MACENVGLYISRKVLESQPISSHWLYQRTKANQQEKSERLLPFKGPYRHGNTGEKKL